MGFGRKKGTIKSTYRGMWFVFWKYGFKNKRVRADSAPTEIHARAIGADPRPCTIFCQYKIKILSAPFL
jgi:hypothetical protein